MSFKLDNFNKKNTPLILENMANGLIYALPIVTGIIMSSPLGTDTVTVMWINWGWTSFVSLFKVFSKFFGVEIPEK